MKFIILCGFLFFADFCAASEYFDLPIKSFLVKHPDIYSRIDEIKTNPEPILKRYQPVNMKIKDKVISANQIQFMATKVIFGISKNVLFKGIIDIADFNSRSNCFVVNLDFSGSGDLIIDNIERLEMVYCLKEKSENQLMATVTSRALKGAQYGGVIGNIAKNLIADQVDPIIASIKEEIER